MGDGNMSRLAFATDGVGANNGQAFTKQKYLSNFIVEENIWHHYCLVYDREFLRFYFDGGLVYITPAATYLGKDTTMSSVLLGSRNDSTSSRTDAYYNSFMVFNRPLQSSEIGLIMNQIRFFI